MAQNGANSSKIKKKIQEANTMLKHIEKVKHEKHKKHAHKINQDQKNAFKEFQKVKEQGYQNIYSTNNHQ